MIDKISNEFILGIELEDNIFDGSKVVGSFYKNTGSLEVLNYDGQYSDLVGQEITIEDKGTWYLNKIENNEADDTAEFELYDLSYRFDTTYVDLFESGMTVYEWLEAICNECGVELGSTSFPNSTYELSTSPFVDETWTYRNVVQMIAEAGGCFAKFENDELIIRYFSTTEILLVADWTELTTEDSSDPINIVVLGNDLEDNIMYPSTTPDNPVELSIDNNEILYLDRETMIIPIYDNVEGTFVTPFSISFEQGMVTLGNVKSGIILNTINKDYQVVSLKTMNITATYNGVWGYVITAEIPTETETEYQYAGTITKTVNETSATVDKLNGEIILYVSETTTNFETISGQLSDQLNEITGLQDSLNNYATSDDLLTLTTSVEQQISNTYSKTEVQEIITGTAEDGTTVTVLANSIMTVDIDGLTMDSDNSSTKTVMQPDNFSILDKTGSSDTVLFTAKFDEDLGETVVESDNLSVDRYINLMGVGRIEKYTDENNNVGVGLFLM